VDCVPHGRYILPCEKISRLLADRRRGLSGRAEGVCYHKILTVCEQL
jgi:hypothetical protein